MCAIYVELQFCLRLLCQLEIKYSYQIQPNTQIMQQQKLSLLWKVSAKKGPYFFLDGKGVYQIKRHICNCCIIYIKTYLLFSPLFMQEKGACAFSFLQENFHYDLNNLRKVSQEMFLTFLSLKADINNTIKTITVAQRLQCCINVASQT